MSEYNPFDEYGSYASPHRTRRDGTVVNGPSARVGTGIGLAFGYVATIWMVHIINFGVFGGALNAFGVHPLDLASLWHIFTSPLLHGSWAHLWANTVPGAIFCFLIGLSGARVFWEVTAISCVLGGLGTWFFGGVGTTHIGASGLIYGWLAYLIIRGIFNRSLVQVVLGVVLAFVYGGLVWGVFPVEAGVSWQGHLFGAIGGIVSGAVITSDDPPALKARREQKRLQR
ncbi:rhomboid family protein [Corynebacterium vitaeruminis DSM 20294]|uniref:Rhomboid family protein n=1 Tax=Corynebacterium vitaeruminis DSM 20294 TaxID=1224164 RepID=W5Y3Q3_9CORY|nr:rhomboid family protein [Corynebacterium vitaeruminis DSM 20294]